MIREQVARAERDAAEKAREDADEEARILKRAEGEKITLNFGGKPKDSRDPSPPLASNQDCDDPNIEAKADRQLRDSLPVAASTPPPEKISLKMGSGNKPKNVFATSIKKNALSGSKPSLKEAPKRPMSEAERIMRQEIERKQMRETKAFSAPNAKRQKTS